MTVNDLIYNHKKAHPNSHFFDKDTLSFFGERISDMKVLKEKKIVKGKSCFVLSTLQRNAPGGQRRSYHFFDEETFDNILED